ncbi:MAG: FkbM family methyltransferase [Acutalibacteraceae bacterium]
MNKPSVWQYLKNTDLPIVMYGTGNGADKILDNFIKFGINIHGIMVSSGFVRDREFRGYKVHPIEYFEEELKEFIVVIAFGSNRPEVLENIKNISQNHKVLVPSVQVCGTDIFDEAFAKSHEEEIIKAYSLLEDGFSKKVYKNYVEFLYTGEIRYLEEVTTPEREAYENVLQLEKNETFIDIGAFKGDTVEKFLEYTNGSYKNIVAVEPDKKTFNKLLKNCNNLENFKPLNAAVTDVDGTSLFSGGGGRQSSVLGVVTKGVSDCNTSVTTLSLKSVCEGVTPTFIKIDSEGYEQQILEGGKKILEKYRPKMNIAAYHKNEDIFKLPILLKEINPDYQIHLRHHPYIPGWDTIFYVR